MDSSLLNANIWKQVLRCMQEIPWNDSLVLILTFKQQRIKFPCWSVTTQLVHVPFLVVPVWQPHVFLPIRHIYKAKPYKDCSEECNWNFFPIEDGYQPLSWLLFYFFLTVWLTFWCQYQLLVMSSNQPGWCLLFFSFCDFRVFWNI